MTTKFGTMLFSAQSPVLAEPGDHPQEPAISISVAMLCSNLGGKLRLDLDPVKNQSGCHRCTSFRVRRPLVPRQGQEPVAPEYPILPVSGQRCGAREWGGFARRRSAAGFDLDTDRHARRELYVNSVRLDGRSVD